MIHLVSNDFKKVYFWATISNKNNLICMYVWKLNYLHIWKFSLIVIRLLYDT